MVKKIFIAGFFLAVALAVFFVFFWNKDSSPEYRTEKAAKGDIVASITATGVVNAVTTVLVGTQVSGTIKEIYADFNSPVKKGEVIARIDQGIFRAQADQARANLLAAKANLGKSKAGVKDAKRTFERNLELFRRDLIARSDVETSETNQETAVAQVNASEAEVARTRAALKLAETNLAYTEIVSPVQGVVVSRNVDVGQTVAASFQTPTLFTIAEDLTKMQVNSSVAEADIGRIRQGMHVEFTVDAYTDKVFKGEVFEIRIAPIVVQNVVTYDVMVKVSNPELNLKPGMTANVTIIHSEKKGVLRVPNAALRFNPDNGAQRGQKAGGAGVWVSDNGVLKRVKLVTGISDGSFTEVIEGDLKEGQDVVIESLSDKNKGQPRTGPRFF